MKSNVDTRLIVIVSFLSLGGTALADEGNQQDGHAVSASATKSPEAEAESVDVESMTPPEQNVVVANAPKENAGQSELAFADHLFLDGDYYRAITEYRRFLFAVRGRAPDAPRAAMAIGEALLRGEKWDAAGRQYDGIATRTQQVSLRQQALFAAGRAYLMDARPEMAKPRFRLLVEEPTTPTGLSHDASWFLAWGHFDAGELEDAYKVFLRIAQSDGAHATDAQGVVQALLDKDKLDQKDPMLAGLLSIVPGLGHFYLGRWGVGLTSLTWNGVF